ncbi:hypothetical protein CAP35_13490 [Chitinophagaceae bacterium IBVUCB1]|nr:hypothetical protein CAP35_13490 [Chitinophagaceae bacterium IBVUCB1]
MKRIITLAIGAAIAFTSCTKERIKGEGSIVEETRSISGISNVNLNGSEALEIVPSKENKVVVSGYQNLVPVYKTNVSGSTLNLEFERKYYNVRNNNIKVTLYTTSLNKIELNGSGSINIKDSLKTESLTVEINGSGSVYSYPNYFQNLALEINGSGNLNMRQATGKYVHAKIAGSGNIEVTVQEKLDANISGSGDIKYWGNPSTVNTDVSGSGRIRKQ